jgi:hypothetical protein
MCVKILKAWGPAMNVEVTQRSVKKENTESWSFSIQGSISIPFAYEDTGVKICDLFKITVEPLSTVQLGGAL